ncbi:sulfotransferase [Aureococcus anophagefferens]|nr:sulfotransferase [Aureococcus anophagefferens]
MRRWRVASDRDVGAARGARAFGSYTFNVSDGRETFPLWYGMTEGYPWSQPVDGARYDALHAGVRLRPRDVTVASYPKTGTTWVEQIVLLLLHGSGVAPKLDPASRNSYVPGRRDVGCVWLEPTVASKRGGRFTLDQFDAIPAPRVIKSHAPFDSLVGTRSVPGKRGVDALTASGSRVVYVSRNPRTRP